MNLLLDTHIFLWFINANPRLDISFREEIQNPENNIYLSVVSFWEIIIKNQIGKLPLPVPPEELIPQQRKLHKINHLDLDEASVANLNKLPQQHRDPFDRMIICQSITHDLTIVTVDRAILQYEIAKTLSK